jgi:predicted transcriptional regulator of viral defense system
VLDMSANCVVIAGDAAQNGGMQERHADNSSHRTTPHSRSQRLRAAGLGAFFRPSQLEAAGFTPDQLPSLMRQGLVTRVSRGLYRFVEAEPTENYSLAMACARVPNSIVCLLSALRVHGIGSQAPAHVWLGIPHKARTPRLSGLKLRIVHFSGPAWTFAVKPIEFEGVPARITSPARTIADCFRLERLVGPEVAVEALRDGLRKRLVTIAELARVDEVLPSRRLRAHLHAQLK